MAWQIVPRENGHARIHAVDLPHSYFCSYYVYVTYTYFHFSDSQGFSLPDVLNIFIIRRSHLDFDDGSRDSADDGFTEIKMGTAYHLVAGRRLRRQGIDVYQGWILWVDEEWYSVTPVAPFNFNPSMDK